MPTSTQFSLSRRLRSVGFSDIVQIRNKILELRDAGEEVYEFHGGEPYFETPDSIKQSMATALAQNKTHYAPSSGIAPLRQRLAEKLARKNGLRVTADDILITTGGMQALYAAFQAVLNPGEECIVFSPLWTPIRDILRTCEAEALLIDSAEARQTGLRHALRSVMRPSVRAIYYNTPNNPSGLVFTREEAKIVAE